MWDAKTGAELLTLKGHTGGVDSASFSPDGSRIVTGESGPDGEGVGREDRGRDSSPSRGTRARVIRRRSARTARGSSPASDDKTAKVWDAKTGAEILTLKGHTGCVTSASFSPDGTRIVTGSWDKTAKVWDAKTGAELLTLKGHTGIVDSASFSPDGSRIVTGSWDKTAKVWDAKTGAEVLTLKGHTGTSCSASFSPDGTRIVTGE